MTIEYPNYFTKLRSDKLELPNGDLNLIFTTVAQCVTTTPLGFVVLQLLSNYNLPGILYCRAHNSSQREIDKLTVGTPLHSPSPLCLHAAGNLALAPEHKRCKGKS